MTLKVNNLRYFISQATHSIIRNGLTSVTSIFTVFCCMLILGLFLVLGINVNYIADQIKNDCPVQAFVSQTVSQQQLSGIKTQIEAIPNVASAELFTKEDSLNYMRGIFGENADVLNGYETDNPFRDSYNISLTDLSLAQQTMEQISKINGIAEVKNDQSVINTILEVTGTVRTLSFWIMIILGVVSIFIIANTIKLAVYSRRKEINVMKFVGATNWFIRWPFIFEGIIIGIIGALAAFAVISWAYIAVGGWISGFNFDLFKLKTYEEIWWILISMFVVIGAAIGAVGSGMSLRKHLDV